MRKYNFLIEYEYGYSFASHFSVIACSESDAFVIIDGLFGDSEIFVAATFLSVERI